MVYIHKKTINDTNYYTLRLSVRKGDKIIAKDIANLGTDINKINLEQLEKEHKEIIRKSYKTIKKFLETNKYLEQAKQQKLKQEELLTKEQLEEIEAAKNHYQEQFLTLNQQTQKELIEYFLIRFAVNSTAIEGNTITLQEATKLLLQDKIPKNKTTREVFDLTNTKKVFYQLFEKREEITQKLIIEIHDKLLEHIDERKGIRNHDIHIYGQPFNPSPAMYVTKDLDILIEWYHNNKKTTHPFILATLFHHKFEQIHPFSDGNGRTGRMLANHILMKHMYPPIVIDKKERTAYLEVMSTADRATKNDLLAIKKEYKPLLTFTTNQLKKSYWDIFLI